MIKPINRPVCAMCRSKGYTPPPEGYLTARGIASEFGYSYYTVRAAIRKLGLDTKKPFDPEQIKGIVKEAELLPRRVVAATSKKPKATFDKLDDSEWIDPIPRCLQDDDDDDEKW